MASAVSSAPFCTSVFISEIDQGTTALVFVGRGQMTFRPAPDREKSQVRIFSGAEG